MSSREWDRNKPQWDQQDYDYGYREEDYADTKRRKFNNGGYDPSSQPYDNYDGAYSRNSNNTAPTGAGGNKKRSMMQPSPPTPHVIMLGLDPDFTEADLQAFFAANGYALETATIIRERSSGASKGFGFAQFTTTEEARTFVDPQFPFVQVPPPASHGASATAAFYAALETGAPHTGRRVKIDYSQSAGTAHGSAGGNGGGRHGHRHNANDGTRDIGNAQVPVLLFRGLDPLSGPQAILQAIKGSGGPGVDGAKRTKRIVLVKDKVTMASFGFAFVEFVDVQAAATVLAATMSSTLHPAGFRISDRPVAASFAHPYSFQPIEDMMHRDESCIPSSLHIGGVEGTWVKYWDEGATVVTLEFDVEMPVVDAATTTLAGLEKEKEKKKKSKTSDLQTRVSAPTQASVLPISDKPVTLTFGKGLGSKPSASSSRPTAKPIKLGFSLDDSIGELGGDDGDAAVGAQGKVVAAKSVAPLIASKKTVNNINKWNQVQEELTQNLTPAIVAPLPTPAPKPVAPAVKIASSSSSSSSAPAAATTINTENEFEFSDVNTFACLLCARQFKSLDQLKRHNKDSDLHKKNYADSALREVAREKVLARQQPTTTTTGIEQPKYRDRASERRVLFNQPDAPMPEKDVSSSKSGGGGGGEKQKQRTAEAPPAPAPPPPPPVNPGKDTSNVGNKLLKMMGWTEGSGLGTSGDGRVDPISTAVYAQGVGLGASKGKDVTKYAQAQSGSYLHMAQDAARERYNES